jgi:hypothetical protein
MSAAGGLINNGMRFLSGITTKIYLNKEVENEDQVH